MRRPPEYSLPRYNDPNDRRLVRIIKQSRSVMRNAVNIVGVPFDGAVLGRRGAAGGPAAIRTAMSGFSNYNVELGVGLGGARVFDLGDLVVQREDVLKAHSQVEKEVGEDLESGSMLVVLGGDNSISLPSLRAFGKKFGEVGLVVVDSHFDLRGRIGGKPTSGSSYGLAIKAVEGLDPTRVAEIGIHGFLNSRKYAEKAEELGIGVFTARDVRRRGPEEVAEEAYSVASKGADAVYLSVDIDAVDLAEASGVSAPSAGGISAWELFELVYGVSSGPKVSAADIVEVAPALDPTGNTQRVAATALTHMIGAFEARRRKAPRRNS